MDGWTGKCWKVLMNQYRKNHWSDIMMKLFSCKLFVLYRFVIAFINILTTRLYIVIGNIYLYVIIF